MVAIEHVADLLIQCAAASARAYGLFDEVERINDAAVRDLLLRGGAAADHEAAAHIAVVAAQHDGEIENGDFPLLGGASARCAAVGADLEVIAELAQHFAACAAAAA